MTLIPDADDVENRLRQGESERVTLARELADARRRLATDRMMFTETDKENLQRVREATEAALRAGLSEETLSSLGLTDKKPRRARKSSPNSARGVRRASNEHGAASRKIVDELSSARGEHEGAARP